MRFRKPARRGTRHISNTRHELQQYLDDPALPVDAFIERCHDLHQALDLALQQGRDRLLEMNSCRPAVAEALIDEAMQRELEFKIIQLYGANLRLLWRQQRNSGARDGWVITPGDNMLTQMPGLPEDGMTVTYDRSAALANEDLHYLTWEHPFVRNAMDMILSSEFGNTALIALGYAGVKAGTLLAECHFLMEFSDDAGRRNERFFPTTSIRVVIDEGGRDHAEAANLELALQQTQRVDHDTAIRIVKARQGELTQMLAFAELGADTRVPGLIAEARDNGRELLGHEVDRLVALQQVNPGVRDEEIEFFKEQLEHFEIALQHARLRLDAVRVIVAI